MASTGGRRADWLSEDETPIRDEDRTEMVDFARTMGNKDRVAGPLRLCLTR